MSSAEKPQKIITLDDIPGMTPERKAQLEAQAARPTFEPVPLSDYKGNPARVIGFPQEWVRSPHSGSIAEYRRGGSENVSEEVASVGEKAVQAATEGLITSVPVTASEQAAPTVTEQPLITEAPFEVPDDRHLPAGPQREFISEVPNFDQR